MKENVTKSHEQKYADVATSALMAAEDIMRGTGRTNRILAKLKRGDILVVSQSVMINMYERILARDYDTFGVHVIAIDPKSTSRFSIPYSGTVYFEHSWVLSYMLEAVERARREIASVAIFNGVGKAA